MQGRSYSFMLRELANYYYQHQITFQDYRAQRRKILNSIDSQYNRIDIQQNIRESANIATARTSEREGTIKVGETKSVRADSSFSKGPSD